MTIEQKFTAAMAANNIAQFVLRLCGFAALWEIENGTLWVVVLVALVGDVIDMIIRVVQRYRDPGPETGTRDADIAAAIEEARTWRTLRARMRNVQWWAYAGPVVVYCGAFGTLFTDGRVTLLSLVISAAAALAVSIVDGFYIAWGIQLGEAIDLTRRIAHQHPGIPDTEQA